MSTRIIAIVNHKGGVGKTTTTFNLGKGLALSGKSVLLVDIDPQANLSQSAGVEEPEQHIHQALVDEGNPDLPLVELGENLTLLPADLDLSEAELKLQTDVNGYFRLRKLLSGLEGRFDFVLIDCPPSLGVLTINAMIAAAEVLVVVQSQYLAVKGLQTIYSLVERLQENLNPALRIGGMLLTQVNRTVFSRSIEDTVRQSYEGKVFDTVIRQNVTLAEASSTGMSVFEYDDKSAGAEDYRALTKEVLEMGVPA